MPTNDDRNQLYNMISVSGDAVVVIEDPNAEATDGTRAGESVPHIHAHALCREPLLAVVWASVTGHWCDLLVPQPPLTQDFHGGCSGIVGDFSSPARGRRMADHPTVWRGPPVCRGASLRVEDTHRP